MSLVFTQSEIEAASRPHVARGIFVTIDLPTGILRLHNGAGRVVIEGNEWLGMTDPIGGRIVGISGIEEPAPGQASAVTCTLSGIDKEFVQYIRSVARQLEGREANVYFCLFDTETQEPITALRGIFIRGSLSAPSFSRDYQSRVVSITIENIWAALNFAPGRRWNDSDQQREYPGDKGWQFAGVQIIEIQK